MSHSHARSQLQLEDVDDRGSVHDQDAKLSPSLGLASSVDGTDSHDPHATSRHVPDFESLSSDETQAVNMCHSHDVTEVKGNVSSSTLQMSGLVSDRDREGPGLPAPRVRFLSRVRISAGRRRRHCSDALSSNASSASSSSSSSISVPLRTQSTESNGWGPLGRRVHLLTSQSPAPPHPNYDHASGDRNKTYRKGNENEQTRRRRRARSFMQTFPFLDSIDVDERARLITSATRHSYVENRYTYDWYHDEDQRERLWREQLVDEAFGKWPARLLNRHWWWWHLEPTLCCFCEPDDNE